MLGGDHSEDKCHIMPICKITVKIEEYLLRVELELVPVTDKKYIKNIL